MNEIITAKKIYNSEKRYWQYVLDCGQVLVTSKTEKGLDSNWAKYLKVFE